MGSLQRPFFLCFLQCAVAAIVSGVVTLFIHSPPNGALAGVLIPLLYAGVISGAIGFSLQVIGQRHTPPAEASLIMSLESVFALVGGWLLLGERLHTVAAIGCGLILLAVLIVEVVPALRQRGA
jgi:drug/metabolite transporter (DMT)-like permease